MFAVLTEARQQHCCNSLYFCNAILCVHTYIVCMVHTTYCCCSRWAAGSCTFRGKRLQIWLDDEETGQDIACLEGSQSYLPTSELDTLIIRGNKQSLTDPEWIKIVVATGMAMARQCRKDLNPGIVHAAAC